MLSVSQKAGENIDQAIAVSAGPVPTALLLEESRPTSVFRYLLGDGLCSHWMPPSTTLSSVVRRSNLTLHF